MQNRKKIAMSNNVFADIGIPDPETHLAKAKIVHKLSRIIAEQNLTQVEAGARLGLSQPKLSALLNGHFRGYSVERLLRFVTALHHTVHIVIEAEAGQEQGQLVVA
jgi:predicted XRE-type DNA-binding protein